MLIHDMAIEPYSAWAWKLPNMMEFKTMWVYLRLSGSVSGGGGRVPQENDKCYIWLCEVKAKTPFPPMLSGLSAMASQII